MIQDSEIYFNAYDGAEQTGNLSASQNQRLFYMLPTANVHSAVLAGNVIELDGAKITINMLNCRPQEAEKFADSTHEANPLLASEYERMLFIWKGHYVEPNLHWNSMQKWTVEQLDKVYAGELWQKSVKEIMERSGIENRKTIVVDLWAIYYLQKVCFLEIMNYFEKVYITHDTISMALQEINKVNDDDIRRALFNFQRAGNVIIQSPTIKDQLEVRSPGFKYMEIHQALLLAEILDCPAFVGEFRYPIPERFKERIIRPNNFIEIYNHMPN